MTTVLLDYRGTDHSTLGWNKIANNPIANLIASDGVTSTGWALNGTFNLANSGNYGAATTSGAAAWVTPSVISDGMRFANATAGVYSDNTIENLNDSLTYTVECYSASGDPNRVTRWRVNAAILDLVASDGASVANATDTVIFAGVSPVAGVITIGFTRAPGSGATGANAARITENAAADTTAPTFNAALVVTATSETGHTIASTLNETGTLYGVRLASGATAPSSAQVKAGQNNAGTAALEAASVAATAATNANLVFSTGAASTAYAYYIVAEDDETTPNLQATPTLVSATTAATAVPGIGQLTVQFEGVAINVADWHIITRLAADQSILYNQTAQSSDASGNIAAFATTSGSVGDPVRVEGLSAADAYSFVIEQNLGNIA
jgi:hypothetical protein